MRRVVSLNILLVLRISSVFYERVYMVRRFSKWTACCSGVQPRKESFMSALAPFEISGS